MCNRMRDDLVIRPLRLQINELSQGHTKSSGHHDIILGLYIALEIPDSCMWVPYFDDFECSRTLEIPPQLTI